MAITSVYSVIAVWIPVTVVPTSSATVAIDTFITELSRVIRNWPEASVKRTRLVELIDGVSVAATTSPHRPGMPRVLQIRCHQACVHHRAYRHQDRRARLTALDRDRLSRPPEWVPSAARR